MDHLRDQLQNDYNDVLIEFMLVSFVFGDPAIFSHTTKVAVLRIQEDLRLSEDVPIPQCIIGEFQMIMLLLAISLTDLY